MRRWGALLLLVLLVTAGVVAAALSSRTGHSQPFQGAPPTAAVTAPAPVSDAACRLLTTSELVALGTPVTAQPLDLPAGLGGAECTWTGRAGSVTLDLRTDTDLDPALRSQGVTARSVLDDSIAAERDHLTAVPGLGTEAFAGRSRVYAALQGGQTLLLSDAAGLSQPAELALARTAATRAGG